MQYTSNQHKSNQDFTYINMRGPSASYLAVSVISNIPLRVGRDFAPLSLSTESYYDKHTNTTEICPDYYISPLERSIRLIISIMIDIRLVSRCVIQIYNSIQFNYEQYFISYSLYVCLDQSPTLECASKRRARQMAIPASPAHHACVVKTTTSDTS